MGLTSDRKPCVLCDDDRHPQDSLGQCIACRPPEKSAPGELLALHLEVAVQLWIDKLQRWPWWRVQQAAHEAADVVASKGDALQFGGRKGEAAQAFNAMARGLAALSFCPGGAKFLGRHWQATHPDAAEMVRERSIQGGGGRGAR